MLGLVSKNQKGILHTNRLVISFAFIFIILVALVITSAINKSARDESAQWVKHTNDIIRESERLINSLETIENNSRSFIITGWDFFADSTKASKKQIENSIQRLKEETRDNASQQDRINKAEALINERIKFSYENISERREHGLDAAVKLMETKKGIHLTGSIRKVIAEIQDEEKRLLDEREKTNEKYLMYSRILSVIIQAALFGMLLLILLLMVKGLKAQKKSEQILRQSNEWFSRTLSGIGDGVITTDNSGVITYLNPVAEALTGWSKNEATGKSVDLIFDIVNEDTGKPAINPVKKAINEKQIVELEKNTLLIRKDKKKISIDDSAAPIFDKDENLLGIVLVFRDVEKQRNAEKQIIRSNERLSAIFDLSPVASCITDVASEKIIFYNSAFSRLFSIASNSINGAVLTEVVDISKTEEDGTLNISTSSGLANLIIKKRTIEMDNRHCSVIVFVDNTERKKLIEELELLNKELEKKVADRTVEIKRAEKKFRTLIENNNDIILLYSSDGNVTYQSSSVIRVLGWTEEEYKNMYGFVLVHSEDLHHVKEIFAKAIENPGVPFSALYRLKSKQGNYLWMEGYYLNLQNDPDVNAIVVNLHDITERYLAMNEIKEGKKRMENILQSMGDAFVSIDPDWNYTFVNNKALSLMGKTSDELLGQNLFKVFPDVINTNFDHNFSKVMNERVSVKFETYYASYNMWLNVRVYPHDNGIAVFYTDISTEKNAKNEILRLNQELEQRVHDRTAELEEANKELESFSYSVSHDLRAPLRSIHGYTSILKEDYGDKLGTEGLAHISTILKSTNFMGKLIEDLLMFSKLSRQNIRRVMLNMDVVVKDIAKQLIESAPTQKIEMDIKPLINVLGDETMIKQIFQNLISNAIKYSSKKEISKIEIGSHTQSGFTTFYVKDNGAGFDMEYYEKLFAVFQRLHTRNDYEGTGVGLALVNRIVQKHGGKIWADAKVDQGATFYFSLPNQ
jgi:PAS domain S-box-containing protein